MNHLGKSVSEVRRGEELPLMESFYSIQGEGYHQGRPAWFIRLAGCDVGCVWCDVKASWDTKSYPVVNVAKIVKPVLQSPANFVIITGGEPLLYDLNLLTGMLRNQGKAVHLETSGSHRLSGTWDWICLSPKKFKKPYPDIYNKADELKVVIYHKTDLPWANTLAGLTHAGCRLYLQPEWSKRGELMPLIVGHVKKDPRWEISLQIHKYMNIR